MSVVLPAVYVREVGGGGRRACGTEEERGSRGREQTNKHEESE
jgi:hypothetical protein